MKNREAAQVSENAEENELKNRCFPAAGFLAHNRERTHALQ